VSGQDLKAPRELPALPGVERRTEPTTPAPATATQAMPATEIDGLVEVVGEPQAEVEVHVGKSRIFELKRPVSRVFLGNPAIANVRFLDQEQQVPKLLDVYGLSFGATTLTIWDLDGKTTSIRIRVTIDSPDLEKRIARIFPGADVKVSQIASQVILEGQVPDAKTMSEVLQVVQAALLGQSASIPMATTGGLTQSDGVIRAGYQQPGPTGTQDPATGSNTQSPAQSGGQGQGQTPAAPVPGGVQEQPPVDGQLPTTGPMPAEGLQGNNNQLMGLQANGPRVSVRAGGGLLPSGTIINRVHVPGPRQVLLKVKIAELNRTAIRDMGANGQAIIGNNTLNWAIGGIGSLPIVGNNAGFSVDPTEAALVGIFDSGRFTLFLNALRQNNLARIVAEPNLVALDGQPARFIAGGSFPFPVPQAGVNGANVITIQFRDFGAILQFVPHIIGDDAIRLDVEPSFSELNFGAGTSVDGTTVPGINQRSARTVVELREGQTLAIAGLLQNRTNASTARIPLLGDAPIIGPFFSKNHIETLETELVVLVTPVVVEGLEPNEVPQAPGDWYREPNDCEFYLLGRIEGRTGKPFRSTLQELDPFNMMRHHRSEQAWVVGPHGFAD
jgi:pilus assembly protein CpaC